MVGEIERVQHDRTPQRRNADSEVPHVGSKVTAIAQYLCIARGERYGPLVLVIRPRKVESSKLQDMRQRHVRRGERERPPCVRFGLLIAASAPG
jgi:hypothetical protein